MAHFCFNIWDEPPPAEESVVPRLDRVLAIVDVLSQSLFVLNDIRLITMATYLPTGKWPQRHYV